MDGCELATDTEKMMRLTGCTETETAQDSTQRIGTTAIGEEALGFLGWCDRLVVRGDLGVVFVHVWRSEGARNWEIER